MNADWVSAIANVTLAATALGASVLAKKQIDTNRQVAATQMSGDVLKIEIDHPDVTNPEGNHAQYESYMGFMLTAYEQILAAMCGNGELPGWRNSVKYNLRYHRNHFVEDDGRFDRESWLKFYDIALVNILQEIVEEQAFDA